MNLEEKVNFLDSLVGGTLSLTHFCRWELSSYESDSLFTIGGSIGHVSANTLIECIDKAIRTIKGELTSV